MENVFHRLITPGWLSKDDMIADSSSEKKRWNKSEVFLQYGANDLDRLVENGNIIEVPADEVAKGWKDYSVLMQCPLVDAGEFSDDDDLLIALTVGVSYRRPSDTDFLDPKKCGRVAIVICQRKGDGIGMGFELRDPCEYAEWGPYRGVEMLVEDSKNTNPKRSRMSFLPDDRGNFGALEYLGGELTQEQLEEQAYLEAQGETAPPVVLPPWSVPDRFEMTLRPSYFWGRCASALEGGHSVSVGPFFRTLRPNVGLSLGVFGACTGSSFFDIKYIEVSISK